MTVKIAEFGIRNEDKLNFKLNLKRFFEFEIYYGIR